MSNIAYFEGRRLHIRDYDPRSHEGKIYCADGHLLIAKKGAVKSHHYSHRAGEGGDHCGSEGKGNWHLWWQDRLLPSNIEFKFLKVVDGVEVMKIADSINVIGPNKDILSIVEFQNSKMEVAELQSREAFYTRSDLMSVWGIPSCRAELTWIFNLESCDIEIDAIFGDLICFRWLKGTKYMLSTKCRTFFDLSKQELILFLGVHKADTQNSRFIGRLISLAEIDCYFFNGALAELDADQKRTNRLHVVDYRALPFPVQSTDDLKDLIDLVRVYYFKHCGKASGKKLKKEIKDKIALYQK